MANFRFMQKPEIVLATKGLADTFAHMPELRNERPLNRRRIDDYRQKYHSGEFREIVIWATAYCEETKDTVRVNGKHTSHMLLGEDPFPKDFYVTVAHYTCKTQKERVVLWNSFDSNKSNRTGKDAINAYASIEPRFEGLSRDTWPLVVYAASYKKWGKNFYAHGSQSDRAPLLLENVEFTIWLDGIMFPKDGDSKRASHLRRNEVARFVLETWSRDRVAANEFWIMTRDESGPLGHPTRVLAKWLTQAVVKTSHTRTVPGTPLTSDDELYRKCLHEWNNWRKGRQGTVGKMNKVFSQPIPPIF